MDKHLEFKSKKLHGFGLELEHSRKKSLDTNAISSIKEGQWITGQLSGRGRRISDTGDIEQGLFYKGELVKGICLKSEYDFLLKL